MKWDEYLIDRLRNSLGEQGVSWTEKRMFGGNCFLVNDKMHMGTYKGGIMVRVGPDAAAELVNDDGAEQMIHGGREMKGYLMVSEEGYDLDEDLDKWVEACLAFNPMAKSSKKRN